MQAQQIDQLQQDSRNKNVRITGLKPVLDIQARFASTDSCIDTAVKLFKDKLGVTVQGHEIDDAFLLGNANTPQTLVLKFMSTRTKQSIMKQRSKLKTVQPMIYINDDLTKRRADLFKLARRFAADRKIYSAWSRNGNIYTKEKLDSRPKILQDESGLPL